MKIFIRFMIAKGVVTYGLELMMALLILYRSNEYAIFSPGRQQDLKYGRYSITGRDYKGSRRLWIFESIPIKVTPNGGLFITVLSFIMIMSIWKIF